MWYYVSGYFESVSPSRFSEIYVYEFVEKIEKYVSYFFPSLITKQSLEAPLSMPKALTQDQHEQQRQPRKLSQQ